MPDRLAHSAFSFLKKSYISTRVRCIIQVHQLCFHLGIICASRKLSLCPGAAMPAQQTCHRLVDREYCKFGCTMTHRTCHAFAKGWCRFGILCKFAHGTSGANHFNRRKRNSCNGKPSPSPPRTKRSQSPTPRQSGGDSLFDQDLIVFNIQDSSRMNASVLTAIYRVYALELHPDKFCDADEKARADTDFKRMKSSYDRLLEHCKRVGAKRPHREDFC